MDNSVIGGDLQVLLDWQPPPFVIKPFSMSGRIGNAGWRRTGRSNFATATPFGSELIIYERYLPYRAWRAQLNQTAGLKRAFPWVDWRVNRRSPETYDTQRQAAEWAWADIVDNLGRPARGFNEADWEVVP